MINNIPNSNIPSVPPQRATEIKNETEQSEVQKGAQDTVSISSKGKHKPTSDPIVVNLKGILAPFGAGSQKTCAEIAEKAVKSGFNSVGNDLFSDPKKAKTFAKITGAVPAGFAHSAAQVADVGLNGAERLVDNTEIRLNSIKNKYKDPSTSGFKTGLAVAGSIIGGAVGTVADLTANALEMTSAIDGIVKRTVFNSVDNLEGTKKKSLPKSHSLARKEDISIQKLTEHVKKSNGVVLGTALGLSCALLGGVTESAAECMDMGTLIHERMETRARAKGINYKEQKKAAFAKYEESDKGITDKARLLGTRVKQTTRKVADMRVGDVLRGVDSVMKFPKRVVINTARNIGDVFK